MREGKARTLCIRLPEVKWNAGSFCEMQRAMIDEEMLLGTITVGKTCGNQTKQKSILRAIQSSS